jgi:hypothetical protein
VLPTVHEDLLKLGFSRDPLARMQALHPRFYEFFDLERAFAIRTETVAEARALETRHARGLRAHRAPVPLTATRAGGLSEWYRGAYAALHDASNEAVALGFDVVAPLRGWVQVQLERAAPLLHAWTGLLDAAELEARGAGAVSTVAQRRVLDVLDAYPALGLDLSAWLPDAVHRWHAEARRCSSAS